MANEELKNDTLLVAALKYDSHEAFVKIFRQYYANLVLFTARFIPDKSVCEDIVQEAFIKIWSNRKNLEIKTSIRSYLTTSVQNLALDELRHRKVKNNYLEMNREIILSLSPDEHMFFTELSDAIDNALEKLSPGLRVKYSSMASKGSRATAANLDHNIRIFFIIAEPRDVIPVLNNSFRSAFSVSMSLRWKDGCRFSHMSCCSKKYFLFSSDC